MNSLKGVNWIKRRNGEMKQKGTPTQVFSYEYCEIFKSTISTEHLQTTSSLVKFHRIICFRIMSKIPVNHKDKIWTRKSSATDICLENFRNFWKLFWIVSSKNLPQQTKKISTLAIKSLVSPQMMLLFVISGDFSCIWLEQRDLCWDNFS